jgi:integrase
VGLYKICDHDKKARDRCAHGWWGSFRGIRVSLNRWADREIRSKLEASAVLDLVKAAIRAGTFDERGAQPRPRAKALTFREFVEIYRVKHVVAKKLALSDEVDWRFKEFNERFGHRPLAEIKTGEIEDYVAELKEPRTVNGRPDQMLAPASINRRLQSLRHMFNWAVGREYLEKTPFRRGTQVLIRLELEDNKRRRRISEDEETALIAVAPLHLRSMIITALDTGMRRGEMLALRFSDIDWNRRLITLRGSTTKSKRTRQVPIGTERLLAVLDWLRIDGAGDRKADSAPVFSNEAGEPLTIFKKAWTITVLKAHGFDTHWRKGSYKDLTHECQERLREIDLHWHDLRHEYASRLVERGVPLAQVRDLLGHASITTTERYDNQTIEALSIAVTKLDTGKRFDPNQPRVRPSPQPSPRKRGEGELPVDRARDHLDARTPPTHPTTAADTTQDGRNAGVSEADCRNLSSFFQDRVDDPRNAQQNARSSTTAKWVDPYDLEGWYRYGDSNPGPVAENHVS